MFNASQEAVIISWMQIASVYDVYGVEIKPGTFEF